MEARLDESDPPAQLAVRVRREPSRAAPPYPEVPRGARDQEVAVVTRTFVPTYQGLAAADFLRAATHAQPPFPLNVPNRLRFYRATSAIYHLCRALRATFTRLTILAPDYNSGNEILAMR